MFTMSSTYSLINKQILNFLEGFDFNQRVPFNEGARQAATLGMADDNNAGVPNLSAYNKFILEINGFCRNLCCPRE